MEKYKSFWFCSYIANLTNGSISYGNSFVSDANEFVNIQELQEIILKSFNEANQIKVSGLIILNYKRVSKDEYDFQLVQNKVRNVETTKEENNVYDVSK